MKFHLPFSGGYDNIEEQLRIRQGSAMEILGQVFSFGAMGCNVFSLQQKKKRNLVLFQLLGSTLFAISFFLMGAYSAFLQNVVATVRNVVFSRDKMSEKANKIWTGIFLCLFLLAYGLTFWVFGEAFTPKNAILQALPTIAMCIMSVAFSLKNVFHIRLLSIVNAVFWLVYSIIYINLGDIVSEVLCIGSSVIAIIRYDLKKTNKG